MMAEKIKEFNLANAIECSACTCFNTRKIARVITQVFDEAFKKIGFRSTQFNPLVMIFARGPVTVNKLSVYLVMDRTTLGRNLKPLEREGLIEITSGEDRRQKLISITDKGKELLIRAFPVWQETQKKVLKQIGENKWNEMLVDIKDLLPKLQKVA
jgi:DNA-binding MarR family transcriptional regulator